MNAKNKKLELKAFKQEVERYKNDYKKTRKEAIEYADSQYEFRGNCWEMCVEDDMRRFEEYWEFLHKWQESLLKHEILDKAII